MERLLKLVLSSIVRRGSLQVTTASGAKYSFGDGTGEPVEVRFANRTAQRGILLDPELRLGEAYMDGSFVVERGTISDFLEVMLQNLGLQRAIPLARTMVQWRKLMQALLQWNGRSASRRNAAHHYDVDLRIYRLFLDPDLQYSCAYYEKNDYTLEQAQSAKKRHIAAKLLLKPGQRILDIGSGWGGLGLYLARSSGARVTGVTLSKEQLAVAQARTLVEADLTDSVDFRLQDYRDVNERYDRIVSVGMFEHVGVRFYYIYFGVIARALEDDGIALLHSIGRSDRPYYTNPWIARYIFPGGYIPSLSEVLPAIERVGLLVTDIEILRLHYAETLKAWRERFLAQREEAERLCDQRFIRMWEFYLAASEIAFRDQNLMVFQIQMTKRQGVVPITRDYIAREEQRLHLVETRQRQALGDARIETDPSLDAKRLQPKTGMRHVHRHV
jgi:cyclopropane-fatty-acyl-phospholipid synthase